MICVICKKKAKWRYSPDLDIQGIGACSKHKSDVQEAYMLLMLFPDEPEKAYLNAIEKHKDYVKDK